MVKINFLSFCFVLLLSITNVTLQAQNKDTADGLIKFVVEDIMNIIKNDKTIKTNDFKKINDLVDKNILPYTDFQKITRLAMGKHWNKATFSQKEEILKEFKTLLIRIYSGALMHIKDKKIQYKPLNAEMDATDVIVKTLISSKGGESIQINYRVEKTNDGWKVYDINVLGIWLVESYRNQFNDQIMKNGIDGLLQFLKKYNSPVMYH